jgi:hypothetical protein
MPGNDGRLFSRAAPGRDDAVRKPKQPDVVDNHVSPRSAERAGAAATINVTIAKTNSIGRC